MLKYLFFCYAYDLDGDRNIRPSNYEAYLLLYSVCFNG